MPLPSEISHGLTLERISGSARVSARHSRPLAIGYLEDGEIRKCDIPLAEGRDTNTVSRESLVLFDRFI